MWHIASEELPEVGQLVVIKDIYNTYVIRIYHPSVENSIKFWTEFPINGWLEAKDFKDTIRKSLVIAVNINGYVVREDFFFSKCGNDISCGFCLYTHYQCLPLID